MVLTLWTVYRTNHLIRGMFYDIEPYDITFTLHLLNCIFLEKITLIYEMLILHLLFFYISQKIKYMYIFQSFNCMEE